MTDQSQTICHISANERPDNSGNIDAKITRSNQEEVNLNGVVLIETGYGDMHRLSLRNLQPFINLCFTC